MPRFDLLRLLGFLSIIALFIFLFIGRKTVIKYPIKKRKYAYMIILSIIFNIYMFFLSFKIDEYKSKSQFNIGQTAIVSIIFLFFACILIRGTYKIIQKERLHMNIPSEEQEGKLMAFNILYNADYDGRSPYQYFLDIEVKDEIFPFIIDEKKFYKLMKAIKIKFPSLDKNYSRSFINPINIKFTYYDKYYFKKIKDIDAQTYLFKENNDF